MNSATDSSGRPPRGTNGSRNRRSFSPNERVRTERTPRVRAATDASAPSAHTNRSFAAGDAGTTSARRSRRSRSRSIAGSPESQPLAARSRMRPPSRSLCTFPPAWGAASRTSTSGAFGRARRKVASASPLTPAPTTTTIRPPALHGARVPSTRGRRSVACRARARAPGAARARPSPDRDRGSR